MANSVNTVKAAGNIIAKLAAGHFSDNLRFLKSIDKADPSDFDGKNGYKSGDTIDINVPTLFTKGTTADITSTIQDVTESRVALAVTNRYNVPISFTSAEIATDMGLKSWADRVLKPAMINLANNVEADALDTCMDATFNSVGTAGSTVFDTNTILSAGRKLDENGCNDYEDRFVLLSPAAAVSAVNSRKGLFQSSTAIAEQYKSGAMGMADGFTFLRNNLVPTHTLGNDVSGVAVEADVLAPATGASTVGVDGLTSTTGTVTKGSVFTIATVNAVHPITKADLGYLKQFVVTANATADGSGQATLSISPTIYSTGALQNVSALHADEDAITFVGSASTAYRQNLAYHKSAFRFVSLPLIQPEGVHFVGQETHDGVTVRVLTDYDILTDKMILRADILWGIAAVRPEWACRITE